MMTMLTNPLMFFSAKDTRMRGRSDADAFEPPTTKRMKRNHHAFIASSSRSEMCFSDAVRRRTHGRISVFDILDAQLQQRFSLDNGMAIQRLLDWCLDGYRSSSSSSPSSTHEPLCNLRKHREPLMFHWRPRTHGESDLYISHTKKTEGTYCVSVAPWSGRLHRNVATGTPECPRRCLPPHLGCRYNRQPSPASESTAV